MFVLLVVQLIAAVSANLIYDTGEHKYPYDLPGVPPASRIVLNAQQCQNMAAFAVTGAIEIATQKLYERGDVENDVVKMSEQEIVDCYYASCNAGDEIHMLKWIGTHGRLSSTDNYWQFLGDIKITKDLGAKEEQSDCRAARAPNDLQVKFNKNYVDVEVDDIDYYLENVGFVFARMVLNFEMCPDYFIRNSTYYENSEEILSKYKAGDDGLIDGYEKWLTGEYGHILERGEGVKDIEVMGDHVVLIVGSHEDENGDQFLVVRDSRGPLWMRRGHFLVRRGDNTCGIEVMMRTVEYKALKDIGDYDAVTKCPSAYPVWCEDIKTCTKQGQSCVADENPDVRDYHPETNAPAYKKDWDFGDRDECKDRKGYEKTCADVASTWKNCFKEVYQTVCAGSCLACARDTCQDARDDCAKLTKFCKVRAVRSVCPFTCQMHPNDCGSVNYNIFIMANIQKPPQGSCYAPSVDNGKVLNGAMLKTGEEVKIKCDAGFVLSGEANKCIIQDLFGDDSRRMQSCIPGGEANFGDWEGDGSEYSGTQSVAHGNFGCLNTLQIVAEGLFNMDFDEESGKAVMNNAASYNNVHCRNTGGGAAAPWCFSIKMDASFYEKSGVGVRVVGKDIPLSEIELDKAGQKFCSLMPRCGGDFCANVVDTRWDCSDFKRTAADSCNLDYLEGVRAWQTCAGTCCHHGLKCPESGSPVLETPVWTTWQKLDLGTGTTAPWTGAGTGPYTTGGGEVDATDGWGTEGATEGWGTDGATEGWGTDGPTEGWGTDAGAETTKGWGTDAGAETTEGWGAAETTEPWGAAETDSWETDSWETDSWETESWKTEPWG